MKGSKTKDKRSSDLSKMNSIELKAAAYDVLAGIQGREREIGALQQNLEEINVAIRAAIEREKKNK